MNKYLSIHGFGPESLKKGDVVGFIIKGHFRVGKVKVGFGTKEDNPYDEKWCIEGVDGKTYYPYSSDTVVLNDYVDAKQIATVLKEV